MDASIVLSMEVQRLIESWEILVEIWEVPAEMLISDGRTDRLSCRGCRSSKVSMVMLARMEACSVPEDLMDPRGRLIWEGSEDVMEASRLVAESEGIESEDAVMEIEDWEIEIWVSEVEREAEMLRGPEVSVILREAEIEDAEIVTGFKEMEV